MSDAQDQKTNSSAKKTVRKSDARPRHHAKPKSDAASARSLKGARSIVPEIPPIAPGTTSRRASTWRLVGLTTTLTVLISGLAWFNEAPESPNAEPTQIASAAPSAPAETEILLPPPAPTGMEQEFKLATLALDIRESQESLTRLWEDARALASSVGALASGIETLKSDVSAARQDALVALARVDERFDRIETAAAPELILLGDPALRDRAFAERSQPKPVSAPIVQAGEIQPATTGALPEAASPPQASVKVSFAKKPGRPAKPINGWLVHNVRDDIALVEGQGSHYEVRTGELLPGAGIVRAIKKRGETWVVLTNKGVIKEPK